MMKIAVLTGGVGGAKFLRGLRDALETTMPDSSGRTPEITAIVNTGDDLWLAGLRVCPDLDSIMYTLGGVNDEERGWGRATESERISAELSAYGVGWPWFTLGDLDLGTHIARSHLLREGYSLSAATAQLCERWNLGVKLLPMSDHFVETQVVIPDEAQPNQNRTIHFEEWWVRYRASVPAIRFIQKEVASSTAAPGVLEAIHDADIVLLAPSNPVVSLGTILGIPGIREAVHSTAAPVVGVSPIISGAVVRGMADACLSAIGVPTTADAVAVHYGARKIVPEGILDAWLIDESDRGCAAAIEAAGIRSQAVPLWMNTRESAATLAADALTLAASIPAQVPGEQPL